MKNATYSDLLRSGSARLGAIATLLLMVGAPLPAMALSTGSLQAGSAADETYIAQSDAEKAYEAIVASGQQQLDERNYEGALATFERAIAQYADAPRLFVGKGEALYGLGRFEEATTAFGKATELAPDYLYAWVWLGNAYDDNDQLDLALDAYSTASRLDSTHPMPYYHRGIALWYAGRDAEAEADFRNTVEIIPDFSNAWMWLGRSLGQQEQYEESLLAFDQALTLEENHPGSLFGKGRSLLELERYAESVAAFDTYLLQESEAPKAWFYRGNGLFGLDQYEDALAAYERSLELEANEGAFYNQGLVLAYLERYDEAIASFEEVIALNPENESAREQVETLRQLTAPQARLSSAPIGAISRLK